MSTENGELLIGSVPGLAMAASEAGIRPVPRWKNPRGQTYLQRKKLRLRLITCLTG